MSATDKHALDPHTVLGDLAAARRQRDEAARTIRQLVAYGREFVRPRPYTLAALATAAGMSISGVRTCYSDADITTVADLITTPDTT